MKITKHGYTNHVLYKVVTDHIILGLELDILKMHFASSTVEPRYNEVLGTMKITLLYQVTHYIRVKKLKYKEQGPAKLPCYKRVLLYPTSL